MMNQKTFDSVTALLDALEADDKTISAPVDVDLIAKWLNLNVSDEAFMDNREVVGEISFDQEGKGNIRINTLQNSYEPRRRFTLAHEIGHYCLHADKSRTTFVDTKKSMNRDNSYWDIFESEANAFAAKLLMPKSLLVKEAADVLNNLEKENLKGGQLIMTFVDSMAKKFNVSTPAMEYRLKNLGVIK